MVQECVTYVEKTPDKETKLKLIDTLRTVTEGKIYVEVERARLTQILAGIKEADGDVTGAAAIMEELQVETYGTMEKREKVELILEQMRLCLAKQDIVRSQIISKKISIKFFDDPKQEDLKLKYYETMVGVKLKLTASRLIDRLKLWFSDPFGPGQLVFENFSTLSGCRWYCCNRWEAGTSPLYHYLCSAVLHSCTVR